MQSHAGWFMAYSTLSRQKRPENGEHQREGDEEVVQQAALSSGDLPIEKPLRRELEEIFLFGKQAHRALESGEGTASKDDHVGSVKHREYNDRGQREQKGRGYGKEDHQNVRPKEELPERGLAHYRCRGMDHGTSL